MVNNPTSVLSYLPPLRQGHTNILPGQGEDEITLLNLSARTQLLISTLEQLTMFVSYS